MAMKRNAGTAWLERTNPLRGLSIREAQAIFDSARGGDTQRLHWIFQEIEAANPVLMTCVERRAAAVSGFQWNVTVRPSADQALGDEQRYAVDEFLASIENLGEMIEHLDLGFFRGFSYAQPILEADGTVRRISLLDSWCFLEKDGRLYYNPACDGFGRNCEEVTPAAGLVGIRRRRAIDYPALAIHIRAAVGERDWGRFLERIALPKPAVTMAQNATNKERGDYLEAAEEVEDGKVSVWPNGTVLTDFMGGSRGQDPFSGFIRHQEEKIVLLSTGGTLTSLAQADTGSLAGGAQMEVWREIVARDADAIEGAISRALVRPFLERRFPGRKACVDFTFDRTRKPTAKESAEVAATLRSAGYTVVQDELEEAVGFTLRKDDTPPQGPFGAPAPDGHGGTPLQTALQGFAKRAAASARATTPETDGAPQRSVLAAFSEDTSAAAERVKELLDDPTPEAAEKLLADLPSLIPDDPALAAIIAEAMAAEFGPAAQT